MDTVKSGLSGMPRKDIGDALVLVAILALSRRDLDEYAEWVVLVNVSEVERV